MLNRERDPLDGCTRERTARSRHPQLHRRRVCRGHVHLLVMRSAATRGLDVRSLHRSRDAMPPSCVSRGLRAHVEQHGVLILRMQQRLHLLLRALLRSSGQDVPATTTSPPPDAPHRVDRCVGPVAGTTPASPTSEQRSLVGTPKHHSDRTPQRSQSHQPILTTV